MKPQEIVLVHNIRGQPVRFRFIDNPTKLSPGEWDRIICILVGTQPWQFRGWRITDPATLFHKS